MRGTIYIKKKELENYLERKNYNLITLRRILLKEFGYKNSDHFCSDYKNLIPSVLNIKLAYKNDEEYNEILVIVSDILKYLKENSKSYSSMIFGRDIIFYRLGDELCLWTGRKSGNTLYGYVETTVFRRELISDVIEKTQINGITMSI